MRTSSGKIHNNLGFLGVDRVVKQPECIFYT